MSVAEPTGRRATRRLLLVVGAITVGAGVLRFATLSQGVWFDEAVTVRDISGNFAHLWGNVAHHELSPPLYFVCLWLWRHVFGGGAIALRTMSALAGALTIPVAFAAADRLVGRPIAIVVALIAACSPVMLYYSQELRPYALLVLLCSLGLLAFLTVMQEPRRRNLALWGLVSCLALATHYFAAAAVLPQAAVLVVAAWRRGTLRRPTAIAAGIVGSVLSASGLLLGYQHARSYTFVLAQIGSPFVSERFDAHTAASGNGHLLAEQLLIGPGGPWKEAATLAMLGFVLLALIMLWRHRKDDERRGAGFALLLFLPAIAAAFVFQGLDLPYQGRYLLVLWLPLTIVIGCGLGLLRRRPARVVATTSFCALSLCIGIATATITRFSGRENTAGPARSLGVASMPRLIAIDQQWDLLPLRLYRPQARVDTRAFATVRELDLIAMPARGFPADSDANRPPPPRISGLPTEMTLRQVIRGGTYVVERYTSSAPVRLALAPAERHFSTDWRFLSEAVGARPGGP